MYSHIYNISTVYIYDSITLVYGQQVTYQRMKPSFINLATDSVVVPPAPPNHSLSTRKDRWKKKWERWRNERDQMRWEGLMINQMTCRCTEMKEIRDEEGTLRRLMFRRSPNCRMSHSLTLGVQRQPTSSVNPWPWVLQICLTRLLKSHSWSFLRGETQNSSELIDPELTLSITH